MSRRFVIKNNCVKDFVHICLCLTRNIFFLLVILSAGDLQAQQTEYFPSIQYITSNEGLSQSEVTAILQDKKGFLWIGTRGGLNRYDGSTIKVFQNKLKNPNSLINNSIETLFEDSNGHIWIGTKSNGVSRYFPKSDRFEQLQVQTNERNSLIDQRVIAIAESSNNDIWLGTWQNGLTIFNPKENRSRHLLNNVVVADILRAKDDKMWLATANGIYVFSANGEQLEFMRIGNIASISEDEKTGLFYFGSWGTGLLSYNPVNKELKRYLKQDSKTNSISSNNAYYLHKDDQRNLWIGTWGEGVNRFHLDTKVFTHLDLSPNQITGGSELYKDVLNIYQDKLGILWFGTNGGGLCKVDKNTTQFGLLQNDLSKTALPNEPVWAVLKDKNEYLWVGVKGSQNVFYSTNEKDYSRLNITNLFSQNRRNNKNGIKTMYEDRKGNLWMANNYSLLEILKTEQGVEAFPFNIKEQRGNGVQRISKITVLYQTSDGIFWIGSQQRGLRKSMGPGNPKNQTFTALLNNERITTFLEDKTKRFWVGTYNGLLLYQPDSNDFISYSKEQGNLNSLSSDIIICLYEDTRGNLWVGTPNGLNLAIKGKGNTVSFKSFQEEDGLPNNYIHSIQEDASGNLWISTNKGISRYNISENSFYNFDVNDGLQSNSFMEGASFKGKDGKLYFGGIYGLNIFYPDSIQNNVIPPVVLTGLKISGQEISPGEKYNNRYILEKAIEYNNEIILTHKETVFSIDYTALDFHSSSRYSYRFKMEGLDKDWQAPTSQKNVTYSNLKSGTYEFMVKAISDEKNDDTAITSLKINILPPFWATWQALILYTLIFIGLLYLYRYFITQQNVLKNKLEISKLKRQKEEELAEMKTRFFTDIAHEFRTPLSLISGPVETLIESNLNKSQQQSHLATIQYHTKRLLNLIGQLLDFRKVESGKMALQVAKGNFVKFSNEIFISFRELAASKNILFEFDVETTEIPLTYDRNKMEIVLCNLLSNAFKYAKSEIKMGLTVKGASNVNNKHHKKFPKGYCEIFVSDNGDGMSEDMIERIFDRFYQIANTKTTNLIGTGIGLALVKSIVDLHQGQVFVKSILGEGSTFRIQLPLGETHFSEDQFITNYKKSEDPSHYQVERVLSKHNKRVLDTIEKDKDLPSLLIVEDNPEIRVFVKSIFESSFKIIEAENGIIGLESAIKNVPNVIITDLMMPEMDGLELCNKLREVEETLQIPIIMLTARTTSVFQEKGYHSGADIYVTKPFHPSVLKAQVEGLLNSRRRLKDYFSKKITLLPTDTDTTSFDEEFLNKLMKLVEDNITNGELSREFLASKMAVSASTLYRKIKGLTGLDITAFIRSIRLKRAAQMIQNKEDNISGIAYQVGFNDPKYFRKCFVKQFGITPSQFSKTLNKKK